MFSKTLLASALTAFAITAMPGTLSAADDEAAPSEQFGGAREDHVLDQDAVHLYPRSQEALALEDQGEKMLEIREYKRAKELFASSLEAEWSFATAMNFAMASVMLKEFDAALRTYGEVLRRTEGSEEHVDVRANAFFGLAEIAHRKGDHKAACTNVAVAITLAPTPIVKSTFAAYEREKFHCEPDRSKT
ncbi:MAG TPA: hypothetical protein VLB83_03730 [Candidatus Paceibacterota bacterium]|nr:hypothetical protein [Candidatus Paceibacterota bacterium]